MKTLVTNYTFSAATKQITFTDYPSLKLDQILLITNVNDNIIIYNFADPTAGGTLTGNVLTLTYNTAAMSNTDRLQIFIDDYVVPSTEASLTAVQVRIDNTNTLLNVLTARQDTINISASTINLNTDEVEGLIRTTNSNLTGINLNVNTFNRQLTGQVDTFNRQLTGQVLTINQNVSGNNTNLTNLVTITRDLTARVNTINQNVSATNARLSSVDIKLSNLDTTNSRLQTLINQTDGIEGSLTNIDTDLDTTNANLQTLINQTDGIEGSIDGVENILNAINSNTIYFNPNNINTVITQGLTNNFEFNADNPAHIFNIYGVSYAGYDQYLQIYDQNDGTIKFSQKIKANENFTIEFLRGLYVGYGFIRNSLTPILYTPGNNDLTMTVSFYAL